MAAEPPDDAFEPLWLDGGLRDGGKVFDGFDRLIKRLSRDYKRVGNYHYGKATRAAREFDEMTVLEWLEDNVDDRRLREAVDIGLSGFFGIDRRELSANNRFVAFVAPPRTAH